MPTYCYKSNDGDVIERHFPIGDQPKTVEDNGVIYERDYAGEQTQIRDEFTPYITRHPPKRHPLFRHTKDGFNVVENRQQERQYLSIQGDKHDGHS